MHEYEPGSGGVISVQPFSSQGQLGNCFIEIPVIHLDQVIHALQAFQAKVNKQWPRGTKVIDVTARAKEAGIKYPTAVTCRVWNELIVPDDGSQEAGQDENGRLRDILCEVLRHATAAGQDGELHYQVFVIFYGRNQEKVPLKVVCGPDDHAGLCITIMREDEDC